MERPLNPPPYPPRGRLREFLALARALLYADGTVEAHVSILRTAFRTEPSQRRLHKLAVRTVIFTSERPQPRIKALARRLRTHPLLGRILERHELQPLAPMAAPARLRLLPEAGPLPQLQRARDLADWLRLDLEHLLWFADLANRNDRNGSERSPLLGHYTRRVVPRSSGGIRLIEAPLQHLRGIQRQILDAILAPIPLHSAVHGFRPGRSILTFVAPHVAREAVLRLDLQDFFASISGPRVQALFRAIGYPEAVADLLGGLCTTTTPRRLWRNTGCELSLAELQRARVFYARPHLPQGAPTSPALANLCAYRLDRRIDGLAKAAGAVYTRYADDLAFSGDASFARVAARFARHVTAILAEEGFTVHPRKTRLMRPSVRQHLAGLTLNTRPNLPRRDLDRLEATLTNCVRYGPETQNREAHPEFRRHLEGRVAFAEMVNATRAAHLRDLYARITWPVEALSTGTGTHPVP